MSPLTARAAIQACQKALLLLTLLAAARLGYVAWTTRRVAPTLTPTPRITDKESPRVGPAALIEQLRLPPAPLPSELLAESLVPSTVSSAPERPPPARVYLVVREGPPRTEIRLNGVALGQTPYVGEVTCRVGEPLEFLLIPPKGAPRRRTLKCDRTELVLSEPDPAEPRPDAAP